MKTHFLALALGLSLLTTGCAGHIKHQAYEDQALSDPWQGANRKVFVFNVVIDSLAIKPTAQAYQKVVPKFGRTGIKNFLSNLTEPVNFVNNLLQLKVDDSIATLGRFVFNSTFGLAGLIDISGEMGIRQQPEDFGQTLAYWGVKPGPYVMLPFLGSSTLRDTVALIPDTLLGPTTLLDMNGGEKLTYYVSSAIDTRVRLLSIDPLLEQQVDPYSFIRSGHEQNLINSIFDGSPPEPNEDF